ncbi:choline/ethanolamine kinase-like isoform X2 [Amphiura filiformis]|uniref:choline/ethanolamine kinase-like isoform X2 n=1 Tax=Amphiura filiformis TaxID=82378 RepID=UPI003B222ED4
MDDVDPETRMKAYNWCKDYLGGAWTKIKLTEFQIVNLRAGLSNYLYLCTLPSKQKPVGKEPNEVLLRVYGEIFYEGDAPLLDTVVFSLLSERRHAPKLYGVFREGRLEQYIPSRCLRTAELSNPDISQEIATKLAEFHQLELPLCKVPKWIDEVMGRWTNFALRVEFENPEFQSIVDKMRSKNLEAEMQFVRKLVTETTSPVVFSHNDAQEGNILLTNEKSNQKGLVLIDYEYAGYNYRGFDLANHFVEWTLDYTHSEPPFFTFKPENFPTREQQLHFIRTYLTNFHGNNGIVNGSILEEEETILKEVVRFAPVSHFIFAMWSIVQMKVSHTVWGYKANVKDPLEKLHHR